jgi:hypothetical protein
LLHPCEGKPAETKRKLAIRRGLKALELRTQANNIGIQHDEDLGNLVLREKYDLPIDLMPLFELSHPPPLIQQLIQFLVLKSRVVVAPL